MIVIVHAQVWPLTHSLYDSLLNKRWNHWSASRVHVRENIVLSFLSPNPYVSILDPWKRFWADILPFKVPWRESLTLPCAISPELQRYEVAEITFLTDIFQNALITSNGTQEKAPNYGIAFQALSHGVPVWFILFWLLAFGAINQICRSFSLAEGVVVANHKGISGANNQHKTDHTTIKSSKNYREMVLYLEFHFVYKVASAFWVTQILDLKPAEWDWSSDLWD